MVIAKKPINNTSKSAISNTEKAAEAFISGAGNVPKEDSKKKKRKRHCRTATFNAPDLFGLASLGVRQTASLAPARVDQQPVLLC